MVSLAKFQLQVRPNNFHYFVYVAFKEMFIENKCDDTDSDKNIRSASFLL